MSAVESEGYRPSNGEEGRWFMGATCKRCTVDHPWHPILVGPYRWVETDGVSVGGKSCPIIARSLLMGEKVTEWTIVNGQPTCGAFDGPCNCPTLDPAFGPFSEVSAPTRKGST